MKPLLTAAPKANPMTSLEDLAKKVFEVRQMQKDYFALRDPGILRKCKQLEKELDAELNRILNPETMRQNMLL